MCEQALHMCLGYQPGQRGLGSPPTKCVSVSTLHLSLGRELKYHPLNTPTRSTSRLQEGPALACSPLGPGQGPHFLQGQFEFLCR